MSTSDYADYKTRNNLSLLNKFLIKTINKTYLTFTQEHYKLSPAQLEALVM